MNKEMIISSNGHETRVAILEDDLVAEIFVERERQRGVVGNVYKGRVSKVLPGMQSSFVDIGLERDGFLYVADVIDTLEEFDRLEPATRTTTPANGGRPRRPRSRRPRRQRASAATRERDRIGRAAAEDRRPAEGRPGDPRPGRQGAARHQGRAAHLARHDAGPVPGVHADGRPRRRLAQDRVARGARAPARHRPRVPRGARLHRRRHHPHRRRRPARRKTSSATSTYFHQIWTEIRQKMESSRAAGGLLPGAEPRRQAAARPADRGLHGDPHRQRAGAPARARAGRAHHAEPRCRR